MIKIIVTGASGRMGSSIVSLIEAAPDLSVAAAIELGDSLTKAIELTKNDVIVDFTVAAAAAENARIAATHNVPMVIGTTGMDEAQRAAIIEAASIIPIVCSSNMSVGVNIMWSLIENASRALGSGFHIEIEETHHVHKKDRPSGTAKTMAERAVRGMGTGSGKVVNLVETESWTRHANDDSITVRSFRRDEVVGDHTIRFTGPGEVLTIQHHAVSRDVFAEGALAAARWIVGRPAGLYSMSDVLGLNNK